MVKSVSECLCLTRESRVGVDPCDPCDPALDVGGLQQPVVGAEAALSSPPGDVQSNVNRPFPFAVLLPGDLQLSTAAAVLSHC